MIWKRAKTSTSVRIALAVLMLFAQGMAFAHDIDHVNTPDNEHCIICPVYSGTDGHSVSQPWCELEAHNVGLAPQTSSGSLQHRFVLAYPARAPPYSS